MIGLTSTQTAARTTAHRLELIEELYQRYGNTSNSIHRIYYWRKKYSWLMVVGGIRIFKRALDVSVALIALTVLLPVFILITMAIKLTDFGPVLFWQIRVGRWGREFQFPKFRSMVLNAEELKQRLLEQNDHGDSVTFKMKKDPRITFIGRLLRKLSLDELPQLWCVLKGDMSLVGPRPPVRSEVEKYTLADRRRLDVKPGLTCIWQVSGRGDIAFKQQVELDVQYIESQSLWLDFRLLVLTIPAVLSGKGAY